jgi:hypothetical protein
MRFMLRMDRVILTEAQWAKMEPHCLGKLTDPGRSGLSERAVHGATCPPGSVTGARRFGDFGVGGQRMFSSGFSSFDAGVRHGIRHDRCHHRQGSSSWTGRKRGTASQAMGRSKAA